MQFWRYDVRNVFIVWESECVYKPQVCPYEAIATRRHHSQEIHVDAHNTVRRRSNGYVIVSECDDASILYVVNVIHKSSQASNCIYIRYSFTHDARTPQQITMIAQLPVSSIRFLCSCLLYLTYPHACRITRQRSRVSFLRLTLVAIDTGGDRRWWLSSNVNRHQIVTLCESPAQRT